MKRIAPEEVVEAYKATGLKPMRGDYFPDEGCACAMGAIAFKNIGIKERDSVNDWISEYVQSFGYPWGFARGFDGDDVSDDQLTPVEKQGYEDGQAAWKACVESGLVEV